MARVFLSFAIDERDFARRLEHDLRENGVEIRLDERQIDFGSDINTEIEKGIATHEYFGIILSPAVLALLQAADSVFCAIGDETEPSSDVYRDDDLVAFMANARTRRTSLLCQRKR